MQDSQTSDGSLLEDTGSTYDQTSESQTTRMPDSQTSDDGSLLDYNGEGEHVLYWKLLGGNYTECAICGTFFIEDGDIYCPEGCPDEALERLDKRDQSNNQAIKATNDTKIVEIASSVEKYADIITTETTKAMSKIPDNTDVIATEETDIPVDLSKMSNAKIHDDILVSTLGEVLYVV